MHASVGDRIVIEGHRFGEQDRDCEVLEVPVPDVTVQHFKHSRR